MLPNGSTAPGSQALPRKKAKVPTPLWRGSNLEKRTATHHENVHTIEAFGVYSSTEHDVPFSSLGFMAGTWKIMGLNLTY